MHGKICKPAMVLVGLFTSISLCVPASTNARTTGPKGPVSTSNLFRTGIAKANAGYLDEAIQAFSRVLDKQKSDPLVFLNRGKAFLVQGQLEKARTDLERAVELAPELAAARRALGMAHRMGGNLTGALEELTTALEHEPASLPTRILRAAVLFDAGQPQRALEDLAAALKANPQSVTALGNRAYILEQLGECDEALEDLTRVVALDSDNIMAMKHLGYICNLKGDRKAALRWYQMAMKLEVHPARRLRLEEAITEIRRKMME